MLNLQGSFEQFQKLRFVMFELGVSGSMQLLQNLIGLTLVIETPKIFRQNWEDMEMLLKCLSKEFHRICKQALASKSHKVFKLFENILCNRCSDSEIHVFVRVNINRLQALKSMSVIGGYVGAHPVCLQLPSIHGMLSYLMFFNSLAATIEI
jgi:hypothetical protein